MFLAGLQNIPGDVIEAARLDGARYPTILFRIIIPLLLLLSLVIYYLISLTNSLASVRQTKKKV